MSKNILVALILIALSVLVMILTRGDANVNLLFTEISGRASVVYLCFMGLGVTIGVLLK